MTKKELLKDGGLKSRKFWLCLVGFALVLFGGLLAARIVGFGTVYGEYIAGILGCFSIYSGANIGNKWATLKHGRNSSRFDDDDNEYERFQFGDKYRE